MNQFIADIFSTLLKLLHVLVVIGVVIVVGSAIASGSTFMIGYAVVASIVYVVIVGFLSVVLAIHENITGIYKILEKSTTQSNALEKIESSIPKAVNANSRVEPKI